MNAEYSMLYRKILAFPMNERGAAFPFAARLAQEQGWSRAYADRVIEEYKKFVFLKKAAGHSVCPSDQVDQAWHLHLTFTESYWSDFCPKVLDGPLHHTPSRGGPEEQAKHWMAYSQTLASYRALFKAEPPMDIWPSPRIRFFEQTTCQRVETGSSFIVPKAVAIPVMLSAGMGLAIYHVRTLVGWMESFSRWEGASPVAFTVLGMFAVYVGALLFRRSLRKPSREPVGADFDLDLYEAAYLANGAEGAMVAALTHLAGRGMVQMDSLKGTFARLASLEQPLLPLEKSVHDALPTGDAVELAVLKSASLPILDEIAEKLRIRGLLVPESSRSLGQLVPIVAFFAVGLLGLVNLRGEGGSSLLDTPEASAVFLFIIVTSAIGLFICLQSSSRTRLGDRVLEKLQGDSGPLHARAEAEFGKMNPELAKAIAVALHGLEALPEEEPSRLALEGGSDNKNTGCG